MRSASVPLFLLILLAAPAAWSGFAVDAPDSAAARANYGIRTFSNPASSTGVKVSGGVVAFSATYASDSTEGFSANLGLEIPLCPDGRIQDLRGFKGIWFQYRNTQKITDQLNVQFISDADTTKARIYESAFEASIAGTNALAAGTDWKTANLLEADFWGSVWYFTDPDYDVDRDSLLSMVRGLRISPRTAYTASGKQNGTACTKCVGPTTSSLTLEIRDLALYDKDSNRVVLQDCKTAGVARSRSHVGFEASYRSGVLSVGLPAAYTDVDVLSPSGRRVAHMAAGEGSRAMRLERGTWIVVATGASVPARTRTLVVAQ